MQNPRTRNGTVWSLVGLSAGICVAVLLNGLREARDVADAGLPTDLANLAEGDPEKALSEARTRGLSETAFLAIFGVLAHKDINAAMSALSSLEPPRIRRLAALSVIGEFDSYGTGIDRIATALASSERINFRLDAISRLALDDLNHAFELVAALDESAAKSEAIRRIAKLVGERNHQSALASSGAIKSYELSELYRSTIVNDWARLDPAGFLEYLSQSKARDVPNNQETFRLIAKWDARRLLELSKILPQAVRLTAEAAAIEVLALDEPLDVLRFVDSLPYGERRDRLLASTARQIATYDIRKAQKLEESLQKPMPALTTEVLRVLAMTDPSSASRMLIRKLTDSGGLDEMMDFRLAITSFVRAGDDVAARLADQLSLLDAPVVRRAYDALMNHWASSNPIAATDWALSNIDRLTPTLVAHLAGQLGRHDPNLAMLKTSRVPPELERIWVRSVASEVAKSDFSRTVEWLSSYQSRGFYQEVLTSAIQSSAQMGNVEGLPRVAAFLERASPDIRGASLEIMAYAWSAHDPEAAAQWIGRIDLPEAQESQRTSALLQIASRWAKKNPSAALDWIVAINQSDIRDRALVLYIKATASSEAIDVRAIETLSNSTTRQRAIADVVRDLGRSDPDRARSLIDKYISDASIREQLLISLRNIEQVRSSYPAVRQGSVLN